MDKKTETAHTAWVICQSYAREILSREKYVINKEMEFKLTETIYKILLGARSDHVF